MLAFSWIKLIIIRYFVCLFTYLIIDQEERSRSVEAFRQAHKDVLVATDVASKGLDFENIQHVINYDMPDDVENYGIIIFIIVQFLIHSPYLATRLLL